MSDLMLLGVLRMPVSPQSDELTLRQYINRGRQAADLIEKQQQQIAELEATVERLREQLSAMAAQHQCGCGHPACNRCGDDADNQEVLRATPEQNLNAVKREVTRDAYLQGLWDANGRYMDGYSRTDMCEEYLNKLYPSVKDGEQ